MKYLFKSKCPKCKSLTIYAKNLPLDDRIGTSEWYQLFLRCANKECSWNKDLKPKAL